MNRIIFILGSILLISWGCDTKNSGSYNSDWAKISKDFNDSLLTHFPEHVKGGYSIITTFPVKCKESNRCGIMLAIPTDKQSYKSLIPFNVAKAMEYKDSNPCIVLINGHESADVNQICGDSLKIVPDIKSLIRNCKTCSEIGSEQLSGFNYYSIECQKGVFIQEEYLSNRDDLPQLWKNGFSRGIALNQSKTLVIYWLEIW